MTDSDMYRRIDQLCKANGTNITQMCKDLEITRSILSELKSGRTKCIHAETLLKICDHFGVGIEQIMYGSREETFLGMVSEMVKLLDSMTTLEQERALAYMRILARR